MVLAGNGMGTPLGQAMAEAFQVAEQKPGAGDTASAIFRLRADRAARPTRARGAPHDSALNRGRSTKVLGQLIFPSSRFPR